MQVTRTLVATILCRLCLLALPAVPVAVGARARSVDPAPTEAILPHTAFVLDNGLSVIVFA